ncbi:hypothetical protein L1887_38838 [Cichorium endivia]|nr:hypothetical protein L1887_38838 [Cichorium endivia]
MTQEDQHTQSFNLSRIGSTNRILVLFTNDYEVWALHFEDYVLGIEEHGSIICHAITVETYAHTGTRRVIKTLKEYNDLLVAHTNIPQDEKDKLMCNIKAFRIIRFALQSDTLRLPSTGKFLDADLEHSVQTTLLSGFGSFEQAPSETLIQVFIRYNHLLNRLLKYKIARTVIEQKVTFLDGLRPEWKSIVSTIKAHEQFKTCTLVKVMGILKSHEKEITSEPKITASLGSLALVTKGKKVTDDDSEFDFSDEELTREDKALMVSNPKKIFKKYFSKFKTRNRQGSFSSEKPKEDAQRKPKADEEKRLLGDSGYDCHYCKGKNHFIKDFLLRKQTEKEQVKDEAYYAKKIADLKKEDASIIKSAFVVQEDNEYGVVEVWSTDSDDEEVRKPTHGRCFVVKNDSSELRGYSTDGFQTSASCFAAKPVSEQVEEWDAGVNKVHTILKSLNICSSSYDTKLDNLRITLKNEERRMKIDALESELVRVRDNVIYVQRDNLGLHKMILPFLELKEDEIDAECYSEMSEISVEDEVDCSIFVNDQTEIKKDLISENSVAFARIVESKGSQVLNEQATVFPKIQTVPNQVFVKQGLNPKDVTELKVLVDNDNSDGCDAFFWTEPIDNSDKTKGLSEMTSWKSRGNYISGSINCKNSFSQTGTSGTKPFPNSNHKIPKPVPTKNFTQVIRAEQYDPEWYIDSGCSCHMTGRREELREYQSLRNGGRIRYGNNATGEIKGYGMITNGELSIRKVAYVEGLQHNLISVSQLVVGTGLKVTFDEEGSELIEKNSEKIVLKSKRKGEMFPLDMKPIIGKPAICLLTRAANDDSWLWHRCLSHMNFRDINKLVLGDLVRGLPLLKYDKERLCDACELGKQSRMSHSTIINTKIIEPLELLHIDLCGPSTIESVAHNTYILVVVDNFSRFTWQVRMIRIDNGTEFKNQTLDDFLVNKGISHNFSAPYTPQQNGVVERRNRSLCEAARTMLSFAKLPLYFWVDAIATTCFTQNRSTINKRFLRTPYEILNKRKRT